MVVVVGMSAMSRSGLTRYHQGSKEFIQFGWNAFHVERIDASLAHGMANPFPKAARK